MWLVATILESRALDLIIRHRNYKGLALAGMAQWIERWPANQRSPVRFPVRAHSWVVGQVPSKACGEATTH